MNLDKKKSLAARTLKVGKKRIVFSKPRLEEIKEAITKQDIIDLKKEGVISIKKIRGRRKIERKSKKQSPGNIRKKVNKRKRRYVVLTRKLRKYLAEMKKQERLSKEEIKELRKKLRDKNFRSKAHLKEYIKDTKK